MSGPRGARGEPLPNPPLRSRGGGTAYDVAVAGGGAIGCALALALARDGFDVALVEPQPPVPFDPAAPHDLRTYAMSPASIAMLERLGAWRDVVARRASPYTHMRVWGEDASRGIAFDAGLIGERTLGAIVEDRALRDALWGLVVGHVRVTVHQASLVAVAHCGRGGSPDGAASIEASAPSGLPPLPQNARRDPARLTLDRGSEQVTIEAKLTIAADGARSTLRKLAGLDPETAPSTQRAVIANVRTERPHEATAWQRFTADGPLAFLPLSNGECSIVWSVPDAVATELLALDDAAFRARLGESFQHRLGDVVSSSPRAAIPLAPVLVPHYVAHRVALVGDAAHVVLPLAGQGLNLGLLDAAALAQVVSEARDEDFGDAAVLARYERWRKAENALSANAFQAIDRLFRGTAPGMAWLRDTGLALADRLVPIKREFALQASGFAGNVPALSRRA